jgi:hypothetical protein
VASKVAKLPRKIADSATAKDPACTSRFVH